MTIAIVCMLLAGVLIRPVGSAESKPAPQAAPRPTDALRGAAEKEAMLKAYFERLTAPRRFHCDSAAAWAARRAQVRRGVREALGLDPLPERVPLDVHEGGRLERTGYAVRRIYYQIWPGIYASGWIYTPTGQGKFPVVLNPHGHWPRGATDPVVQQRCIGLAKKGYLAMTVDTVHLSPDGGSRNVDLRSYLIGLSTATVQTWSLMRAIDYLETLPEADLRHLGCTGASGGGLQALLLMAVDERVQVAVPAVFVSYFKHIMKPEEGNHCWCNWIPGLLEFTDEPEIAATFAPKPAFYLCVTGDWTRNFPGDEFRLIQSVYGLLGKAGHTGVEQWDQGHSYDQPMRERAYAWFNKWIRHTDDPVAAAEPQIEVESQETLDGLNKPPSGARPVLDVVKDYEVRFRFTAPALQDAGALLEYQKELRGRLGQLLGDTAVRGALDGDPVPVDLGGFKAEKLRIRSEPEIIVPALLLRPEGAGRAPVAILLHSEGKAAAVQRHAGLLQSLLKGGAAVLVPDVRLTGELQRGWEANTTIWGRPEVGMALSDLRACLDVLEGLGGLDARRVALAGLGQAGATALYAGALEPRVAAVAADNLGPTYGAGRTLPLVNGILRLADLPQLAALAAPRTLVLGGAGEAEFSFTNHAYRMAGAPARLAVTAAALGEGALARAILDGMKGSQAGGGR